MARLIEDGKAIRLESDGPRARRGERREWKARGYRVPTRDGVTVWHEREAMRRLVLEVFQDVDADLFLFGSRATGEARTRSDDDLGFLATDPQPAACLARLRDDLEMLPIPSHVDLVDFRKVTKRFSALVLEQKEDLEAWKARRENSLFT